VAMRSLPLGTAYAVWVGIGAVGTAILGIVLFNEPANAGRLVRLGLILAGIIGLKLASPGRRGWGGAGDRLRRQRPGVEHGAEQPGGLLGIVDGRVRLGAVPCEAGGLHGTREHGLAVGHAAQGDGVEHAEGVE